MKGNLWTFVVVVVLAGMLLPAVGLAHDDLETETEITQTVAGIIGQYEIIFSLAVLVVGTAVVLGWVNGFGGGR